MNSNADLYLQHKKNGFTVLENIISNNRAHDLFIQIKDSISICAKDLNCSVDKYLTSASRWVFPSPITAAIDNELLKEIKNILVDFFCSDLDLIKFNIISKSSASSKRIPFHQDLSYSYDCPYEFSLWLALNDVSDLDGALQLLSTSHSGEIRSAVDFWQPNFMDNIECIYRTKEVVTVPIKAGDAVLFDSRLWHGSKEKRTGSLRLALVTRWKTKDYKPPFIPEKNSAYFGMWNCHEITKNMLNQGTLELYKEVTTDLDFVDLINLWKHKIQAYGLPWKANIKDVIEIIDNLRILHLASKLHNAGDAMGVIYANVWNSLLDPMQKYLNSHKLIKEQI